MKRLITKFIVKYSNNLNEEDFEDIESLHPIERFGVVINVFK